MRRRELIAVLGSAGAAWPLASRAAQADRVRRIAVIMGFAEDDAVWQAYLASFRQRLQDFGWSEGRNIRFDYWFTGESTERMRAAATDVVAMAPDVIFVSTNPVVSAVLQETRTIPIVFTWVSDSVGSGYVEHLAHPGGNITGFHNYEPALGPKWMVFSRRSRQPCGASPSCTFQRSARILPSCAQAKRLRRHWEWPYLGHRCATIPISNVCSPSLRKKQMGDLSSHQARSRQPDAQLS